MNIIDIVTLHTVICEHYEVHKNREAKIKTLLPFVLFTLEGGKNITPSLFSSVTHSLFHILRFPSHADTHIHTYNLVSSLLILELGVILASVGDASYTI